MWRVTLFSKEQKQMKGCIWFLGALALWQPGVEAVLVGGFNGSLDAGWTGFGDVSTVGGFNNVNPSEGAGMLRLTTADLVDEPSFNFSGTNPVQVGNTLETQLALPEGIFNLAGDSGFEGSAVRRTLTVAANDRLIFEWSLLTTSSEPDFNDYGFFSVGNQVNVLASTTSTSALPGSPFLRRNAPGLTTQTFTFANPGTFAIAFGVIDVNDFVGASALLVDNVRIEPVPFEFNQDLVLGGASLVLGLYVRAKLTKNSKP
ncbi:MAG: hypothetical protein SFT94_00720 [Pseudanabaenaceae cyanobacterium bins.68]|nr:hypothetical protein [Pseudanabaenaceae cyanobacterium bins.68]